MADDIELGMGKLTSMSSSLSSTSKNLPLPPQYVSVPLPVKLADEANYLLWKSFFIPILKYHDMLELAEGRELCPPQFLDNEVVENPAYTDWIKRDQLLLAWINASLTETLLLRFAGGRTSGRALWLVLENLFAGKAKALVKQLKSQLENLKILEKQERRWSYSLQWVAEKAKKIADKLDAVGSPVEDDEFVSCVVFELVQCEWDELKRLTANITDRSVPLTREELLGILNTYQLPIVYSPPPSVSPTGLSTSYEFRRVSHVILLIIVFGVFCSVLYLWIRAVIENF